MSYNPNKTDYQISCYSRLQTQKLQAMFCSLYLNIVHKREDMVHAGLNIAETMETGDIKNRGMTEAVGVL